MKKVIAVSVVLFLTLRVMAQYGALEKGWYGGVVLKGGQIHDQPGLFAGFQGAWILEHHYGLGGKFYMLSNPVPVEGLQNIVLGFLAGGLLVEYTVMPSKLIHFNIENMIGSGAVYNDVGNYSEYHDPIDYSSDGCFVWEPALNMTINVSKKLRIATGVSYRYVEGINFNAGTYQIQIPFVENIVDEDLMGFSAEIVIKYGVF